MHVVQVATSSRSTATATVGVLLQIDRLNCRMAATMRQFAACGVATLLAIVAAAAASPSAPAIPRQIITGWHATELPPRMAASLSALQAANPSFQLRVFDDATQRAYIAQHFPSDVVLAYDDMLPASYR